MPTSTYSLSSATDASCMTKKKRVSAQLSRLLGSRVSSEDSRRGVSEDGIVACCSNNNISKAAAWMWYARGIGDAAVLPTKQRRVVQARSSRRDMNTRKLQPSRFKTEANMLRSAPADQLHTSSPAAHQNYTSHESQASHDTPESKHEGGPSTFLYDEFELSCLQEMLKREIDKHSAQQQLVSHDNTIPYPRTISSSTSSPSRQIKPFSAIHKLFKRLYTTVHNSTRKNSAINSGPSGLGPRKIGDVQHVIHHHHYLQYDRSLDLPAHDSQPAPTSHLHGFGRRRRANSESCSESQRSNNIIELDLVDALDADAHHRPRRFPAPVWHINSAADDDLQVPEIIGSGVASAYRRHSIEIF